MAPSLAGLRVLVTGATGFVGGHVVRRLRAAGAAVVAPVRRAVAMEGAETVLVERWTPDGLARRLEPVEWNAVVNAAAYGVSPGDRDPDEAVLVNATVPPALVSLAARRGARAFVHLGTCSEYDAARAAAMPLSPLAPAETARLYGATKLAGTAAARAAAGAHGLAFAALRLFNVYGPGEAPHRLLPSLAERLRRGEAVDLSDGAQERDWVYVADAADAVAAVLGRLAQEERGNALVDLSTGRATSVRRFAELAAAALDADPALLRFGALARRPDDVPLVVGDPAPLAAAFGWRAETGLADGIARALNGPAPRKQTGREPTR